MREVPICINGRQKKVGRPRPATTSTSALGSTARTSKPIEQILPTSPSISLENNTFLVNDPGFDVDTYPTHWGNPAALDYVPLQVSDLILGDTIGDFAPGGSPDWMASVHHNPSSWGAGFDLTEPDFMFAFNSVFGSSPPDTATSQISPSTASSDQDVNSPGIPVKCNPSIIDDQSALIELSNINLGLHARVAVAKSIKSHLTFDDLVYQRGPLYIDNYTLAEFLLKTSQSFLQILTKTLNTRINQASLLSVPADTWMSDLQALDHGSMYQKSNTINQSSRSPPFHGGLSEPVSTPLALMITSIFVQLISLYELMLEYTTARVDRLPTEPMSPTPILFHDGLVLENLCLQGALFSRAVVHVLERMQYILGIGLSAGAAGKRSLFTTSQVKMLCSELDSRQAIVPGQGVMGPVVLSRLYGKMTIVFERIAADASTDEDY
ncbi:hypothetical protein ACHAP5_011163 [Fusarium lateritium]